MATWGDSASPCRIQPGGCAVLRVRHPIEGTIAAVPVLFVSEAVAVQIFRLVMVSKERPTSLQAAGLAGVYRILATLACGELAPPPGKVVLQRLRNCLERKASGSHPGGLDVALRYAAAHRARDSETHAMSFEQATDHLLKKWDLLLFDFDFGVAGSGGAGSGGGGSLSGRSLPHFTPQSSPLPSLSTTFHP